MNNWEVAAGTGLAGGVANSLFGRPKFKNPADAAMPYLNKVPDTIKPYYQPFIDRGGRAGANLENQYGRMTNNPGQLYNDLGQGYKESPGYQFKLHQALMAGNNAAAAGGMAGSNQHQQLSEQTANDIASQDFRDYMSQIQGLYGEGIHGEQGLNELGYNSSDELSQGLGNNLYSQANVASRGVDQQNQYNQARSKAQSQAWGDLAGTAAKLAFL